MILVMHRHIATILVLLFHVWKVLQDGTHCNPLATIRERNVCTDPFTSEVTVGWC